MSEQSSRVFSTAFKRSLMERLESGETLAALSKETGIRRKSLYEWRDAWRRLGVAGLNRKRGRKPGGAPRVEKPPSTAASSAPDAAVEGGELAQAQLSRAHARIAELERVIGRQQVDLDFFRQALRLTDASETPARTARTSTRSLKP